MGKKKLIQNYQLLDLISQVQGKYEIYKAKHIVDKSYFTLKKVKVKNDKNNRLYQTFLYEASLLKGIKHPNIVKSIKMMKTTSSIYIVYDFWQGQTLQKWMQKAYKKTLDQKQILTQLHSACISHLYLNPQSIFINNKGDVKVTDFVYGSIVPENGKQIQLQNKVIKTDFTSPQVRNGRACLQSDIYSFGKLIEYLDLLTSKKGIFSTKEFNVKIEEYKIIIRNTTKKNLNERTSIQQVYKNIFKKKTKVKSLTSMSLSISKISGKQSMISKMSANSTASGGIGKTQFVKDIILSLLRRRNMAKLLIDLFSCITVFPFQNPSTLIILSTLLLKKSTIIMNNIAKFMKFGKGITDIDLNQRQKSKFFKSGDYFKLQPLIEKQVKYQKKQLQMILQTIFLQYVKILQVKKFNTELKKQEIDEKYFKEIMLLYVNESIPKIQEQMQNINFIRTIYLISNIMQSQGIQRFFDQNVKPYPVDLMQQPIFIKIYKELKTKQMLLSLLKYKTLENILN